MAEAEHLATNLDDALPAQPPSQRWRKFLQWIATNPDRRMLSVWLCWCVLSWPGVTLANAAAVWLGSGLGIGWPYQIVTPFYSLVWMSTAYALVVMPILCTPRTVYSVGTPIAIYATWCVVNLATTFTGTWMGDFTTFPVESVLGSLATIVGQTVWLGVCFYLVSSLAALRLSRSEQNTEHNSLSVLNLMIATTVAAAGFALERLGSGSVAETAFDNGFALLSILFTPVTALTWCVVMWAQLIPRWKAAIALTSVVLFTAISSFVAVSMLPADLPDPTVTIAYPSLWELLFGDTMGIAGIWIALRIARLGGYEVRSTQKQTATVVQTPTLVTEPDSKL